MDETGSRPLKLIVSIAAGLAIVIGLIVTLLTVAVGSCDAFGGRCPSEPEPLLENDVFGGVLIGVSLVCAGVVAFMHKEWRSTLIRIGIALPIVAIASVLLAEAAG